MSFLKQYVERFCNVNALVIGDIMLDKFEYGEVSKISPEAPVPILRLQYEKRMLGGAGNVVANLASLGCKTSFIGVVGRDSNGETINSLLVKAGAKPYLLKLPFYKTIVKSRFIANKNHLLRVDTEEVNSVIGESILPKVKHFVEQAIRYADIVLLSDYNKGLLTPLTTNFIINLCNKLNKKVIVDPKTLDYSKYAGATLVKPNLKEFSEATSTTYNPKSKNFLDKVKLGAQNLSKEFDIKDLVVTLSEHGMLAVLDSGNKLVHIPTEAKEVSDVSGAGDTSLATLGASIATGASVEVAVKIANVASGIVVGKLGTSTITRNELISALIEHVIKDDNTSQIKKILTLSSLEKVVTQLKEKQLKIGFTNGTFDCCHLGHIYSFLEAKNYCDKLIVAVNSDNSVKRYKGSNRPIQDEKTRALVLASMEFIDYVIIFDEDTPYDIIKAIKPDVLAKEGYKLDDWPEGRLVLEYGGKVVTLKRVEGYSTSNLVKKMKE